MSTRVKICGCTSPEDAEMALEAGADAFGMIFAESSRSISWADAEHLARHRPPRIAPVGVFVNPSRDDIERARSIFPDLIVQLSGHESHDFVASLEGVVIKSIHVGDESTVEMERLCERYASALVLFDTHVAGKFGGTGMTFDWTRVARLARWRPVMVAGGLTPENVAACVAAVRPFAVDVRSGVETAGRKDRKKIRAFVEAVRDGDAA